MGTGRCGYVKKVLRREQNRKRFKRLPEMLQTAISNARRETQKTIPLKKDIRKQYRILKKQRKQKREKRKEFMKDVMKEVNARLAAE